jgi:hypothetical protein
MRKKIIIVFAVAATVLTTVTIIVNRHDVSLNKPVAQLVTEKGAPNFLAKWVEVDKTDLRVLRILALPQDPQAVTNWNSMTNIILVWAESEPGKRNARYFYDEMKNDKSFDGSAWYSRRSLFRGEKVAIVKTDATGNALGEKSFRVDAFSMQLMGFKHPTRTNTESMPTKK